MPKVDLNRWRIARRRRRSLEIMRRPQLLLGLLLTIVLGATTLILVQNEDEANATLGGVHDGSTARPPEQDTLGPDRDAPGQAGLSSLERIQLSPTGSQELSKNTEQTTESDEKTVFTSHNNGSSSNGAPLKTLNGQLDVYLMETGNMKMPKVVCANIATVGTIVHTCCEAPPRDAQSPAAGRGICCLPSIIVGGTQKSGSTALSAIFLQHPNVRFADRKEVHFFSMPKGFSRGLDSYMAHFPVFSMPGNERSLDRFVTVEATPYYLHSADACRFISYTMPSAKVIFILRDPTDRTYSEYNMKLRRIEEGKDLIQRLQEHRGLLVSCMIRFAMVSTGKFVACLPPRITEAAKWKGNARRVMLRLGIISRRRGRPVAEAKEADTDTENDVPFQALPKLAFSPEEKPKLNNLVQMMSKCLGKEDGSSLAEDELKNYIEGSGAGHLGAGHAKKRLLYWNESMSVDNAEYGAFLSDGSAIQEMAKRASGFYPGVLKDGGPASKTVYANASSALTTQFDLHGRRLQQRVPNSRRNPEAMASHHSNFVGGDGFVPEMGFNITLGDVCIAFLEEKVQQMDDSFRTEMENIRKCEVSTLGRRAESGMEVLECLEACSIRPTPGISRQFIYRSLYAPQLDRCYKHISRDQILVLSSSELRNDLDAALDKIHNFTELPPVDYKARSTEELNAVFEKAYPDFQDRTGWRMQSVYPELQPSLKRELKQFFARYNRMLVDMGFSFAQEWNNGVTDPE